MAQIAARERNLLEALTMRIRLATLGQLTKGWWGDDTSSLKYARKRVQELISRDLLIPVHVLSRPLLCLNEPVLVWNVGEADPDPGPVAWRLRSRWTEGPRSLTVYHASKRAISILGGVTAGRVENAFQVTHDLHCSELYLALLRHFPKLAGAWVGEDLLAPSREGQKLPDAVLHDDTGRPFRALEFGGSYPAERVAAFHLDCKKRSLPYELW